MKSGGSCGSWKRRVDDVVIDERNVEDESVKRYGEHALSAVLIWCW